MKTIRHLEHTRTFRTLKRALATQKHTIYIYIYINTLQQLLLATISKPSIKCINIFIEHFISSGANKIKSTVIGTYE